MPSPRVSHVALLAVLSVLGRLSHGVAGAAVDETTPAKGTLVVLSYNIHHGEGTDGKVDLERLARVIRESGADLVGLQEVDNATERTGKVDQTAELARLTGLNGRFARQIDYDGGTYGQAILSRWPIEDLIIHLLPGEPEREQRIVAEARIRIDGRPLAFLTTHLHHQNEAFRVCQAKRVTEVLAASDVPAILVGDMNAVPGSAPLNLLTIGWATMTKEALPTFPADQPARQIDHVLTRPVGVFRTVEAKVLNESVASDHRALRVVLSRADTPRPRPMVIAHRGDSGRAPENTLPAFRSAFDVGADLVETDVQPTKDGVLVCLHDTTLERTTDVETVFPDRFKLVKDKKVWPLHDFTLEEVKRLDAGSWKAAEFAGTRIPTFAELIETARGRGGILVEIKSPEIYRPLGIDLGRLTMDDLQKAHLDAPGADPKTRIILQSFDHECLRTLRAQHACKLPIFALTSKAEENTAEKLDAYRAFADGVAPNKGAILERPAIVTDAHARGLLVAAWTFRAAKPEGFPTVGQEMEHFVQQLGVDGIITDDPSQFQRPEH